MSFDVFCIHVQSRTAHALPAEGTQHLSLLYSAGDVGDALGVVDVDGCSDPHRSIDCAVVREEDLVDVCNLISVPTAASTQSHFFFAALVVHQPCGCGCVTLCERTDCPFVRSQCCLRVACSHRPSFPPWLSRGARVVAIHTTHPHTHTQIFNTVCCVDVTGCVFWVDMQVSLADVCAAVSGDTV